MTRDQDRTFDPDLAHLAPELRAAAGAVAGALRASVPPEVSDRHETLLRSLAAQGTGVVVPLRSRRRTRQVAAAVAASLLLVSGAGTAAAADSARPGDRLYGLDRAIERLELAIARSPESAVDTHLAHASERLQEARSLATAGDVDGIADLVAAALSSQADALDRAALGARPTELRAHVLTQIARHSQVLSRVRTQLAAGPANARAVQALDRAIERSSAKTQGPGGEGGASPAELKGGGRDKGPANDPQGRDHQGPAEPPGQTSSQGDNPPPGEGPGRSQNAPRTEPGRGPDGPGGPGGPSDGGSSPPKGRSGR